MEVSKLNRFIALFIDGLIFSIPAYIVGWLGLELLDTIIFIAGLVYLLLRDSLMGGQSIGKKIMKYKAVREDGSSLNGDFVASLTRNIGFFAIVVDPIFVLIDKPRLGDTLAKTKVVNE